MWYIPTAYAKRAEEIPERDRKLAEELEMYRKLLRDACSVRAFDPQKMECTRDLRRVEAAFQRRMDCYERAQRGRAKNLVSAAARLNRYPTSIS